MQTQDEIIRRASALRDNMIDQFGKSDIVENVEWETIPFLFMVTDAMLYTAGSSRELRNEIYGAFKDTFFDGFAPEVTDRFDTRRQLYGGILCGEPPRSECSGGDYSMYGNNVLAKLLAALTDILVDPACADDYENAPLVLFDETDSTILLAIAFQGVFPPVTEYAAWLRETDV